MRPGANLRGGSNPLGMWFEGPANGSDFRHPCLVTATAAVARIASGLILAETGVQPSGSPLKLSASIVNAANESWVCVEVTPTAEGKVVGADGKLLDGVKVEVVQRSVPIVTTGATGRAPLALLFYGEGSSPKVTQIAMFHLRYETSQPVDGPRRHFFL